MDQIICGSAQKLFVKWRGSLIVREPDFIPPAVKLSWSAMSSFSPLH